MALYISAGRRRRRLYVIAAISVVAGLLVGLAVGRVTAPSPADRAAAAKQQAKAVTGQIEAFPIHYDQVAKGEIDANNFYASLDAGLKRADDDLALAITDAAWLDEPAKQQLRARLQTVKDAAAKHAPAPEFDAAVRQAVTQINAAFGSVAPPTSN